MNVEEAISRAITYAHVDFGEIDPELFLVQLRELGFDVVPLDIDGENRAYNVGYEDGANHMASVVNALQDAMRQALNELGVPDGSEPAPVVNAVGLLDALDDEELTARYLHANPYFDGEAQ